MRRIVAIIVACFVVLTGAFAGYTYADDDVPDFFRDPLGAIASTFRNLVTPRDASGEPMWVTDPSTLNNWYNGDQGLATDQQLQSTKNTGRVWTDKTVSSGDVTLTNNEDHNQTIEINNDNSNTALVGLSALSSAATIQTTDTEVQPLDIVLVLDASPSMATDMTGYEYNLTYDIDQNSTYYVRLDDGSYEEISYSNGSWSSKSLQNVTPKQSDGSNGVQFYTRSEIEGYTRLDAMKEAASQFIDEMAQTNAGISDPYSKHHVSVVKFGGDINTETGNETYEHYGPTENYTQIMVDMQEVNDENADQIDEMINNVTVTGDSTGADLSAGLERAEASFANSSRSNAKKIIIVLSSNYQPVDDDSNSTVNDTINEANSLKTQGVDVYSIGIFNYANPDQVESASNKYMHAISSNYLDPTSTNNAAGGIQLGNRNTGNYYFGASDSAELNDVFNEIQQTLTSNAESPIAEIAQERPGSLTFTDQLGDFMEVKNFKSIVYAGQKFDFTGEPTTSEDGLTTYTFTGSVGSNGVYNGGDLSEISITVKHRTDEKTGDLVAVTVPANLIPLRHYTVTEDVNGKVTSSYTDAYPLRVFYTVGVKDEVLKSLDNPSDDLKKYIRQQTGQEDISQITEVPFYTNAFKKGSEAGDTTATFTPATSNSFYYFTEPTPIYSDPNCQTLFDGVSFVKDTSYYYQRTWYEGNEKKTEIVEVKGGDDLLSADHTVRDETTHRWIIKEGTPRLNRADEFAEAKKPNSTETATDVITPSWTLDGATSTVVAALGNNGKVTHTVPGKLDISKTVDWGNGTPNADKQFAFKVDIAGEDTVVPGDFTFTIYQDEDTSSPVEGGTGIIQDGGTIYLKDDQHVVIEDIPGNMSYTVTETVLAGFVAKNDVTDPNTNTVTTESGVATGTIGSKQTSDVDFTNAYNLQEVTLQGNDDLPVTKTIDGRDWTNDDSFDFTLTAENEAAKNGLMDDTVVFGSDANADSMPVTVANNNTVADEPDNQRTNFLGNITFRKPGTYTFTVTENTPDNATNPNVNNGGTLYSTATDDEKETPGWQLDGISYTGASRTVTVIVTDNGDGTMTAAVSGATQSFTNTYTVSGKLENVTGVKKLTGRPFHGAADGIAADSFTFNVTGSATTLDGGDFTGTVPLPNGTTNGSITINPTSGNTSNIDFGSINFTQPGIYTYTFKEQVPAGATQNDDGKWVANGVTYDDAEKIIKVKVEDADNKGTFKVTVTDQNDQTLSDNDLKDLLTWNNSYEAASNTGTISGSKKLTGRTWLSNESFTFKLEPNNKHTEQAIKDGKITGFEVQDDIIQPITTSVSADGGFNFKDLTFNAADKDGYQFKITEDIPDDATEENEWTVNGVTYDHHTAIVNVSVTDPGTGKLQVTVTPSTEANQGTAFTNDYEVSPQDATFTFGGTKTVTVVSGSYELKKDDFSFILAPVANAPMPDELPQNASWVDTDNHSAGIKVTNGDATNNSASFSFGDVKITFTKPGTYRYTVKEDSTASVPGITFDKTEYTIEIQVDEAQSTGTLTVGEPTVVASTGTSATTSTLAFTNTFNAGQASISIPGTKNLTGRGFAPAPGDTFAFNVSMAASDGGSTAVPKGLRDQQGVTDVEATGNGYAYTYTINPSGTGKGDGDSLQFDFGNITFDHEGTYTFTINEASSGTTPNGMTYDKESHTVVVKVSQSDATLTPSIETIDEDPATDQSRVEFNNTYEATDTDSIPVVKQLGREWTANDKFTFTLAAYGDDTKTAVKNGDIVLPGVEKPTKGNETISIDVTNEDDVSDGGYTDSFENIMFKKAGTYKFVVQEQRHEGANSDVYQGVTYDRTPRIVTITVSHDYQGGFTFSQPTVTTADGDASSLTFNNTYAAAPDTLTNITVTKKLTGRDWTADDKFSFTLAPDSDTDNGATAAAIANQSIVFPGGGTTATVTVPEQDANTPAAGQDGSAMFGGITFKSEGTYHFILTEDTHNRPNVSHDDSVKHLTVTVRDNGLGSLVATQTWAPDEDPTFTNTYNADAANVTLDVQKTLPGATWSNGSYTGRPWKDGESFGFTVELTGATDGGTENDVVMPNNSIAVNKPNSGNVGSGSLGNIQFNAEGTYTFTIKETSHTIGDTTLTGGELNSARNGMTYDDHTATVIVTVGDNPATGDLEATSVVYKNQSASTSDAAKTDVAAFTNTYTASPATQVLTVNKVLQNRAWSGVSFDFTLTLDDKASSVDGSDVAASTVVVMPNNSNTLRIDSSSTTVTGNETAKTKGFDPITFKAPGIYVFKLSENVPEGAKDNKYNGITYDATPRTVTITVEDNGNGGLDVKSVSGVDGGTTNTVTFTNTYGATGVLEGTEFPVTKELTGRLWTGADNFTFELTAVSATTPEGEPIATVPMPTTKSTISTATPGDFAFVQDSETEKTGNFGSITYTQAGTYTYEVRETSQGGNGVTSDTSVYRVSVEVEDLGTGSLDVKEPVITKQVGEDTFEPANSIHFTNKYTASDTTATVSIQKTIAGRGWNDDDAFEFTLKRVTADAPMPNDATGDTVTTTLETNTGDVKPATGAFDIITFTKADLDGAMSKAFEYEVTETSEDGKGVTCDNHAAKVSITVTDNGQGALSTKVAYDNNTEGAADADRDITSSAAFTNVYHASMDYGTEGGINVTKTLLDRPQFADEFSFSIEGQGDAADLVKDADKSFTSEAAAAGVASTMAKLQSLSFDESDAGKTYTFTVKENVPEEGDRLPRVTYDQSEYEVSIQVVDNGNGTMHTLTTVTKTKDADGNAIESAEVVIDAANSDDPNYEIPMFGFTNDYNPNPAEVGEGAEKRLQVTKTVTGAPSPDGVEYGFTLTAKDTDEGKVANIEGLNNGMLIEHTTGVINKDGEDGTEDDSQTLTFDTLRFTAPGVYTFEVAENESGADGGWAFDTTPKTITVTVSDQNPAYKPGGNVPKYDGKLYVTDVTGSPAVVTNSYHADPVTVGQGTEDKLQLSKTVTGYGTDSDFHFTLTPVEEAGVDWSGVTYADNAKATEITDHFNAGDTKTAEFGQITFTEEGVYKFDVTENEGTDETAEPAGWTYDGQTDQLTVTVTDNDHDGFLEAEVSGTAAFTNSYDPDPATLTGSTDFTGTKVLDGRNALDGETFGFKLTRGDATNDGDWSKVTFTPADGTAAAFDTATATATMNGAESASFWFDGQFSFDQAGTYVFNVNETQHNGEALPADGKNGMTYDHHTGTITVTVTENGSGALQASAVAGTDGASMTFTNEYEPTPATYGGGDVLFGGTKTVEDATGDSFAMADGQFTFMLRAQAQGNPMPEGYDGTTVDGDSRAVMSVTNQNTDKATNTATYDFGTITFDKDDMAGAQPVKGKDGQLSKTFQYNVYELETGENAMPDGVSPKDPGRTYTVTFTVVEDQAKGTITVSNVDVKLHNGQDSVKMGKLDFTNVYNADETTGATTIFKTLNGRNWQKGDTFTFDVSMTADGIATDQLPDFDFDSVNGTVNDYTESDGQLSYNITINPESVTGNTFQFNTGTATYKHEGTYVYTIAERDVDADQVPGVAKDDRVYTVTVTIEDRNGTLHREVDITPTTTSGRVDFTNTYTTTGKLDSKGDEALKVTKDFTGRVNDEWLDTDVFKAMLTAEDSTVDDQTMAAENVPMPDGAKDGKATVDLTKDNHKNVAFGDITYTRPGTYNYTLTEVQEDSLEGVYYSYAEYDVVVTAVDNGDGTMTVTSDITQTKDNDGMPLAPTQDVDVATFDNVYRPNFATLDGKQNLTVTKNLEGRDWFGTDEWTFTLALTDGDASKVIMPAQTQLIIDANTPDFKASFGDITFRAAGTYTFTVTESGVEPGVTNDTDSERTIEVDVTDDTKGNLVAAVDAEKSEDLVFTNTYAPEPVTLTGDGRIKVRKTLTGRAWRDGEEFGFTIRNTQKPEGVENAPMPKDEAITIGKPSEGAKNTGFFGKMKFTQAGTYVYEITENVPTGGDADASMTYDGHAATVTVAVTENQADGKLEAHVLYDNGAATTDDDKNATKAAAFTNTQQLKTGLDLTGTKNLSGRDFTKGDAFTFNVTADDNAPLPDGLDENGNVTINPTKGISASINFGTITFAKAGEYVYRVAEQAGEASGMTYDTAVHDVIVSVTDDGQGNLTAVVTPETAENLTWNNAWTFVPGDAVSLTGTKTMTGKELTNGQFTFKVEAQDGAPMGESLPATFNGDATEGENGGWTAPVDLLKDVKFDAEGSYVYLISEVNDGQPGITYDTTEYRVTYTVALDGSATRKIEKSTDGETWAEATEVAFSNSYATEGSTTLEGSANLNGTKTLSGRDWKNGDSFTFVLAAGDEPTQQAIDDGTVHMPETMEVVQGGYSEGVQVPFNFGNIVFDKAGDYTFIISEQQPGDKGFVGPTEGMTYDGHKRTVTVNVADNGSGGLDATVSKTKGDASWTNTYTVGGEEPGTLNGSKDLEVTKVIDGRDWQEGDSFTFTLTADEKNPEGATLPENDSVIITNETEGHKAAFGDITFTQPGNYTFYVNEQVPDDKDKLGGMTYDDAQRVIEVNVQDEGDGTLSAVGTITSEKGLTFTNVYNAGGTTDLPTGGEGSIRLRKVLTGKAWNGDEFTFKIEAADSASAKYLPEQTEVTVGQKTGTNEEGADYADFGFGPITYDKAGTYTYEVRETAGSNPGIEYDGHAATVTVTVSDNLHGGYTASATVENGTFMNEYASSLDFGAEGEGGLWIKKTLTNHDIADDQFEFTVTAADQAAADKAGFDGMSKVVESTAAMMGDDGTAASMAEIFSDAVFTQDDADDTYVYTVEETKGGGAGYDNDGTVYTVTITTADDGNGGIKVSTRVQGGDFDKTYVYDNDDATQDEQAIIPFNNQYEATGTLGGDGSTSIKATKSLANRPMVDGEFTFNVTNAKDPNNTVVATGANDADGNVTFTRIDYTKTGLLADVKNGAATYSQVDGKDTFKYTYTVAENQASFGEGVTAIASSFQITVTVTDNNDGTLGVAVAYPDGGDGLEFRNAYGEGETGQATLNVNGTKTLKVESGDNAPDITGKFTFTLTGSEGAPMPEKTETTNDAAGNVNFGDVTYTMENVFGDTGDAAETRSAGRSKTFTYTVTESGKVAGVTNDAETSRTFEVTVTDNGDGTISVASDPATGFEFAFTNTYSVQPTDPTDPGSGSEADPGFPITKVLTGRDLKDGEFEFVMSETGDYGDAVAPDSLTTTNRADGSVVFGDGFVFSEPGEYRFTISETKGDLPGVTYNDSVYTATATVTDNGDGTLSVGWGVVDKDGNALKEIVFRNSYEPRSTSVSFGASKALQDGDLQDGQFGFTLKADGDAPMPDGAESGAVTVRNAANGSITFGSITFDKAGTYKYTVSEVNDGQDLVTYDDTVYEITVTVTDNLKGHLSAKVSIAADGEPVDGMVFTNVQKKAEPSEPEQPGEPEQPDEPSEPEPDQPSEPGGSDKPSEPGTPSTPDQPSEPGGDDGEGSAATEEPEQQIVQTGSDIALAVSASILLLIAAGGALILKRRSRGDR